MKASSNIVFDSMDDNKFLTVARHYTMGKTMTFEQHLNNLDYIKHRCNKLGYEFIRGCCGHNKLQEINK